MLAETNTKRELETNIITAGYLIGCDDDTQII